MKDKKKDNNLKRKLPFKLVVFVWCKGGIDLSSNVRFNLVLSVFVVKPLSKTVSNPYESSWA